MAHLQRLAIAPNQVQEHRVFLNDSQLHYLGRVLRLRRGDRFIVLNGEGQWWLAELDASGTAATLLDVLERHNELPIAVTLLIAMPKQGMDEIVRQSTELGVATIQPVVSDRTLLKPSPQKLERWRRIAQEAVEQSERQILPTILTPLPWADSLRHWNGAEHTAYLCCARGQAPSLLHCLLQLRQHRNCTDRDLLEQGLQDDAPIAKSPHPELVHTTTDSVAIAIGPEGGWAPSEIEQALESGYQSVSLGRRIFRAATAPVVALSILASVLESEKPQG